MSKSGLAIIAGVALVTLLGLVYVAFTFEPPEGTTTVVIPPPALQPAQVEAVPAPTPASAPEPEPRPVEQVLPRIQLQPEPEPPAVAAAEPVVAPPPVEVAVPEPEPEPPAANEPAVQLPRLNDSDSFVLDGLRAMQNGAALVRLLAQDQMIRKFVVFVENVSRGELPQTGLPYQPLGQEMPVRNLDENLFVMDSRAHTRFDQFVDTFVALDTDAAIVLYRTLSPLFQQAYSEIGFRNVNFDDTLRLAIENVLDRSNVEGPYQLVKPSVMYLYADASIENLEAVHKQLIRLGPDNTQRLQAKLRQFMQRL